MKKINTISFLLIALTLIFGGCRKNKVDKDTPKCIEKKINDFSESAPCDNANVAQYTFQGNTVYTFDPGNCGADMQTHVWSSDCSLLGNLGGLMGNTKINGEEFSKAVFIKTVWEK